MIICGNVCIGELTLKNAKLSSNLGKKRKETWTAELGVTRVRFDNENWRNDPEERAAASINVVGCSKLLDRTVFLLVWEKNGWRLGARKKDSENEASSNDEPCHIVDNTLPKSTSTSHPLPSCPASKSSKIPFNKFSTKHRISSVHGAFLTTVSPSLPQPTASITSNTPRPAVTTNIPTNFPFRHFERITMLYLDSENAFMLPVFLKHARSTRLFS
jgi:hypothetical protein